MKYNLPDKNGFFGQFGGVYAPELLYNNLVQLKETFNKAKRDKKFRKELDYYLTQYTGRPSPLYFAQRLSKKYNLKIYLKREDLNHTGSHKINNTLGQILLAKKMGKTRIIAETGAGQHGVATATACALMGLECEIYMGAEDIRRQELNVFRMNLLGAKVNKVEKGSKTLKDAMNEAIRDWVSTAETTHYLIGSVAGFHPFPELVRYFQKIIGEETKRQLKKAEGKLPDYCVACVGGGSNAIGLFYDFIKNKRVKLIGVEAGGAGKKTGQHAAPLCYGQVGVLHGAKSYLLYDKQGNISDVHSISAGLDYPGVGPEHSYLHEIGRAKYVNVTDDQVLDAFRELSELEGIIPALESSHALAYIPYIAKKEKRKVVVVNISGRGDKDVNEVKRIMQGKSK